MIRVPTLKANMCSDPVRFEPRGGSPGLDRVEDRREAAAGELHKRPHKASSNRCFRASSSHLELKESCLQPPDVCERGRILTFFGSVGWLNGREKQVAHAP